MKRVLFIIILMLSVLFISSCNKTKVIELEDDLTIYVGESINVNDYQINDRTIDYAYESPLEKMFQVGNINIVSMPHYTGKITGLNPGTTYQVFAYYDKTAEKPTIIKVLLNVTVVANDEVYAQYNVFNAYQNIQLVTGAVDRFVIITAPLTAGCYKVHIKNENLTINTPLMVEGYPNICFDNGEFTGFISIENENEYQFVIKLTKDIDITELDVMFEQMK